MRPKARRTGSLAPRMWYLESGDLAPCTDTSGLARMHPLDLGGPIGDRRLRQSLPGPMVRLGVLPLERPPTQTGGPVGRPPVEEATYPGRWSGWASSREGSHLAGPMRPPGHEEPGPCAGYDASALVLASAKTQEPEPRHRGTVLETGTVAPRHTLRWTRPPLAREGGLEDWDRCSVQTMRGAWPECVPSTTVDRLASSR
jgi:hypothetical protein